VLGIALPVTLNTAAQRGLAAARLALPFAVRRIAVSDAKIGVFAAVVARSAW
jgi:hypothetical protein